MRLRADIITAYGLDGRPSDPACRDAAIAGIDRLARAHRIPVTITPGVGSCEPWPTEDVLVITSYVAPNRLADVRRLAEDIRVAYSQDSVAVAVAAADFDLIQGG
jgi:hypothetical protein